MKTKKNYIFLLILGAIILMASCVKDLNFDQVDDVLLTPVVDADFIYSQFDIEEYIPDDTPPDTDFTIPPVTLQDTVRYDLVSSDFAIENLERVELTMEVKNTIQSGFRLQFQFLSDDNQPLSVVYFIDVQPGSGEGTVPVTSFPNPNPIVLDNATLTELANAQKIAVEIITPTLNSDLRGTLDLRSKATYYINYEL